MKEVRMRGEIMTLDESMTDRRPETQGKETHIQQAHTAPAVVLFSA
jgi:hypothetical protein